MQAWINRWISHRFRALVQKELNQIKRDRRIMMSLVLPPIMQLMLFGTVMNPKVANINLGIVDGSQSLRISAALSLTDHNSRTAKRPNAAATSNTPAITAAMLLATAQPVSSWQWMPIVASLPTWRRTAVTMSPTSWGSEPPLVSQSTRCVAPFSTAASTVRRLNSGLRW